jgi:hypothetical protein
LSKLVSGSTTMAIERYPSDANGSQNSRLNCSDAAPMRLAELRSDSSTKQWPTAHPDDGSGQPDTVGLRLVDRRDERATGPTT